MGFRSTFITQSYGIEVPEWFLDKYNGFNYNERDNKKYLGIAQTFESKFYRDLAEDERILDIQKILKEKDLDQLILILLHECGGITRVRITKDTITAKEPTEWKNVSSVEHDYCYGCSN